MCVRCGDDDHDDAKVKKNAFSDKKTTKKGIYFRICHVHLETERTKQVPVLGTFGAIISVLHKQWAHLLHFGLFNDKKSYM
jgi:hypothetical protein